MPAAADPGGLPCSTDVDLRQLAEIAGARARVPEPLPLRPGGLAALDDRVAKVRALLADEPAELEHFEENLEAARGVARRAHLRAPRRSASSPAGRSTT